MLGEGHGDALTNREGPKPHSPTAPTALLARHDTLFINNNCVTDRSLFLQGPPQGALAALHYGLFAFSTRTKAAQGPNRASTGILGSALWGQALAIAPGSRLLWVQAKGFVDDSSKVESRVLNDRPLSQ